MYSSGFIVVGLILYCSCFSSCSRFFIVLVVDVVQSSNLSVPPTATTSCLLGFQNQHVFMSTGQHRALLCSTNSILTIAVMWERFMLNIYLALMVYLYYLYNPIYIPMLNHADLWHCFANITLDLLCYQGFPRFSEVSLQMSAMSLTRGKMREAHCCSRRKRCRSS